MRRRELTHIQRRIVNYLELGLSDDQIAARLNVEPVTVRGHIARLCALYAVRDRTELMRQLVGRRVMQLEQLIELTLDEMAQCPCRCCDAHYRALYNGSKDERDSL